MVCLDRRTSHFERPGAHFTSPSLTGFSLASHLISSHRSHPSFSSRDSLTHSLTRLWLSSGPSHPIVSQSLSDASPNQKPAMPFRLQTVSKCPPGKACHSGSLPVAERTGVEPDRALLHVPSEIDALAHDRCRPRVWLWALALEGVPRFFFSGGGPAVYAKSHPPVIGQSCHRRPSTPSCLGLELAT
ncbi:hypothetical protein LY78DRAFT_280451 [Colletotrichum sublineola]|nr:hypothetical protein LY78DRAFT_280451 [Colletotrichum sublineola]